jgi:predicted nucleotidyltransferase
MPSLTCASGHQWSLTTDKGSPGAGALACPMCGAAPTLEALGAPLTVAAAVQALRDELSRVAGENLAGLILYGGLARGRFRPGQSDVNVAVVLHDASAPLLAALAPALERAWRAAGVVPLLLTPSEIPSLAELFPSKFLDIRDRHVILAGKDAFVGFDVGREPLRLRAEQALRNRLLRLRRRYLRLVREVPEQMRLLAEAARPLALELAALLRVAGKPVPAEDRTAALFAAAAMAFDLNGATLAELDALRHGQEPAPERRATLFDRTLQMLDRAAQVARGLKEVPA